MNKLIFDPLEEFRDKFKPLHNENVNKFIDDLIRQSNVNIGENDLTVKEIKTLEGKIADVNKVLKRAKGWRGFLIFLIIVAFVVAGFFIYQATQYDPTSGGLSMGASIGIAVSSIALAIMFIIINIKVLKPRIRDAEKLKAELTKKLEIKLAEAWQQMNPLNRLFDAEMTPKLVEKTIPLLTMDPLFDARRFDYLNRKYGLRDFTEVNESAQFVQSGMIQGNPFLLTKSLYMDMGTKTYTGSKTVSYTVTVYVNGKSQTQVRTETLTATVTKPCPYYNNDTVIIYGNEAAPNLTFNRYPQLPLNWTQKTLDNHVKGEVKEMKKHAEKALKDGRQFTPLGNTEFEALFHAYNRDHELEYRLLFTALGQSEISDLIKDKTVGFGDDFEFHKANNLNVIRSAHSQYFDYSASPERYYHYDNKEIRARFVKYNNDYIRYFYFNLAPILAVPLYQQHKPQEFIYQKEYKSHLSFYEHEATVNQFPSSMLAHPDSRTQNILKTKLIAKGVDYDTVQITSHGFMAIERVDYVTKRAGNGSLHQVAVHWVEYIPVERESVANIKVLNAEERVKVQDSSFFGKIGEYLSKYTDNNTPVTGRHVMAFLLVDRYLDKDNDGLNEIFKETKKL